MSSRKSHAALSAEKLMADCGLRIADCELAASAAAIGRESPEAFRFESAIRNPQSTISYDPPLPAHQLKDHAFERLAGIEREKLARALLAKRRELRFVRGAV